VGVVGIATEYCVRATALDAQKAKFETAVLTDLIRAVQDKDVPKTLSEVQKAGIQLQESAAWLAANR